MNNTDSHQIVEALKSMSVEERIAYLKANRPELFQATVPTVSFGKAPKGGWKDSDKVAK